MGRCEVWAWPATREGELPAPGRRSHGQDGTEPAHHSWAWLPGLRRELGSYPESEGLHAAGPPDSQLRGHLRWVHRHLGCSHLAWPHSGFTGAALLQRAACGRGFPDRSSREGPEGAAPQPLPLGVCRPLLSAAPRRHHPRVEPRSSAAGSSSREGAGFLPELCPLPVVDTGLAACEQQGAQVSGPRPLVTFF